MSLLDFLGVARIKGKPDPETPLVRLLRQQLASHPSEEVERIAAYAGLLVRVAHVDLEVSDSERMKLMELIEVHLGVSAEQARSIGKLVVRQATELEGIEYSLLTRAVNDFADAAEKERLVDCLYAVATADGRISVAEDDTIRAVSRALLLSHRQFIGIRQRYKEALEVMQSFRRLDPTS
jgi:uncharacterized tellurite resistance protein B-like protein